MYSLNRKVNARGIEVVKVYDFETEKNISLNSEISPDKEMERFGQILESNKFYFIIGSGNGTILEYLANRALNSKFYIIELFEEIDYPIDYKETLSEKNIFIFQHSNVNYLEYSGAIRNSMGMECEILLHPNYERLGSDLIKPVIEKIKLGLMTATINKNTENYFKFEWLTEPILNLSVSKEADSALTLKEYLKGQNVALVSSGPSLAQQIDFLKKNKDSLFIIASGSAVNGLLSHGVTPDYVTVIDASEINYTAHFRDTAYTGPLITTGTTNHQILRNHKGKVYVTNFAQDTITAEARTDLLNIPSVPSVALYSLLLVHFFEVKNVYMVGQDLALSNGNYYANGVHKHANMEKLGPLSEVESNSGGKVQTTYSLKTTLESFNNIISLIRKTNPTINIYNLSEFGAKIDDVPYIAPTEIKFDGPIDKSWIDRSIDRNQLNYSHSHEYLEKLSECNVEIQEALRKINGMNSSAVTLKDLKKLLKIVKALRENEVLERHILSILYSKTKSINNMFEFGFIDNLQANEERVEMLNKLKYFIEYVNNYINALLEQDSLKDLMKGEVTNGIGQS